ncbi:hypothetical protein C8Q79DRAFT_151108 [Trametes meyenii]|nr:hypothetical protein C8Q79DRAFT_151108 [Trametes meyenii]
MPAPAQVIRVIPPPRHRWNNRYVRYILEDDRMEFEYAKMFIRANAPRVLDLGRTWTQQQAGAIEGIAQLVLAKFPTFEKYEDHWPVLYYARQHLHTLRWRSKRRRETRCCQCGLQRTATQQGSAPALSQSSTSASTLVASGSEHPRPSQASVSHNTRSQRAAPSEGRRHEVSRSNDAYERLTQGEQEVQDFLRALPARLDALLHKFCVNGITSKSRLRVMARWRYAKKNNFLKKLLLDRFEREVVIDGLANI